MKRKKPPPVHHSPRIIRTAAKTLGDDRKSKLSRSLSGSILAALKQEEREVCKPKPKPKPKAKSKPKGSG